METIVAIEFFVRSITVQSLVAGTWQSCFASFRYKTHSIFNIVQPVLPIMVIDVAYVSSRSRQC